MKRLGNLAALALAWTVWGTVCALGRILEPRLPDLGDDDYEPWIEPDEPDYWMDEPA